MKSLPIIHARTVTSFFVNGNNWKKYLLPLLFFSIMTMDCAGGIKKEQNLNDGVEQMCRQITASLQRGNNKTLAIMDFTDLKGRKNEFGAYLSEKLIFSMYSIKGIAVVERNQLQNVLKNLEFQQTGLVKKETLQKIGRLTGANAILVGTIADLGESIEVNGRSVNAEDGMIVAVMSVPLAKDKQLSSFFGKTGEKEIAGENPDVSSREPGNWKYARDIKLVYRVNREGDVECASYNGRDCLWGLDKKQVFYDKIKPLACGEQHNRVWGGPGYDNPNHWCYKLRLREQK